MDFDNTFILKLMPQNVNNKTTIFKNVSNKRVQLWFLVSTGFIMTYMFRVTVNITILDMIKVNKLNLNIKSVCEISNSTTTIATDISNDIITSMDSEQIDSNEILKRRFSIEKLILDKFHVSM